MAIIMRKKNDIYRLESVWIDGYIPDVNIIKDDKFISLKNSFKSFYNSSGNINHYEINKNLLEELLKNPNADLYQASGNLKLKSTKGELLKQPKWVVEELPEKFHQENPIFRLYMDEIIREHVNKRREDRKIRKRWHEKNTKYLLYRKFTGDSMLIPKEFSSFYDDVYKENHDSYRQIIMVGEKFDFSPVEDCVGNLIKKVNFKVRDEESYKNYQNFSKGTLAILESILQVFAYLDDDLRQAMTSKIEEADLRLNKQAFYSLLD